MTSSYITDRLDEYARNAEKAGGWLYADDAVTFRQAVEEIKSLRLQAIAAKPVYSRRELEAKNARLREALVKSDAAFIHMIQDANSCPRGACRMGDENHCGCRAEMVFRITAEADRRLGE